MYKIVDKVTNNITYLIVDKYKLSREAINM